jgi:aldehyde dehydrogenase (NAD+)
VIFLGKPYDVVLGEDVAETVSVFRYYAGWADKIYGQTIDVGNAKLAYTKHEPLGKYAPRKILEGTSLTAG